MVGALFGAIPADKIVLFFTISDALPYIADNLGRDRRKKIRPKAASVGSLSFISSRPYAGKNDATGIHPDLPFMRPSVRGDNANRCLRVLL